MQSGGDSIPRFFKKITYMLSALLLLFLQAYATPDTVTTGTGAIPQGYQEHRIFEEEREFVLMTEKERTALEEKNDFLFEKGEKIEYEQATEEEQTALEENGPPVVTTDIDYAPQFQQTGIRKIAFINNVPAITLQRFKNHVSITDIYYDTGFLTDQFAVDEVKYIFMYKEKIGFVGREDLKEYIFYDGKKVSEAFDTITTESCCTEPRPIIEIYDNGAFVFVGKRGQELYFTEVDLNQY